MNPPILNARNKSKYPPAHFGENYPLRYQRQKQNFKHIILLVIGVNELSLRPTHLPYAPRAASGEAARRFMGIASIWMQDVLLNINYSYLSTARTENPPLRLLTLMFWTFEKKFRKFASPMP